MNQIVIKILDLDTARNNIRSSAFRLNSTDFGSQSEKKESIKKGEAYRS